MYRIVALCLPLITLAWPSVQRQFSRQKNFAVNITQRGRAENCVVSFLLQIWGKAIGFCLWFVFWCFLLLNSLLPAAAMCVGLRQRWMSSLSVICPSTWIRSSGCSPFAARRAILSLWKRQIWRLMSTTSTQVMIPLSQLQWSLSSLLFRCNLHTSH